jgi:hypothetical protein
MDNIKIIRLQSGEDIIASCHQDDGTTLVKNPLTVAFRRLPTGKAVMMMIPWIPMEIVEFNSASIHNEDILTMFEPKQSLITFYENTIEDLFKLAEDSSEDLDYQFMDEGDDEDNDAETFEEALEEQHNLTNKRIIH